MKEHPRLINQGFGRAHEFEKNRLRLNYGEYMMVKLEMLEAAQDAKEERFDELHRYLGQYYCHGLEPSTVGFGQVNIVQNQNVVQVLDLNVIQLDQKLLFSHLGIFIHPILIRKIN